MGHLFFLNKLNEQLKNNFQSFMLLVLTGAPIVGEKSQSFIIFLFLYATLCIFLYTQVIEGALFVKRVNLVCFTFFLSKLGFSSYKDVFIVYFVSCYTGLVLLNRFHSAFFLQSLLFKVVRLTHSS